MQLADALTNLNQIVQAWDGPLYRFTPAEVDPDCHPVTVREEAESQMASWHQKASSADTEQARWEATRYQEYWDMVFQLASAVCLNGELRDVPTEGAFPVIDTSKLRAWVNRVADNA